MPPVILSVVGFLADAIFAVAPAIGLGGAILAAEGILLLGASIVVNAATSLISRAITGRPSTSIKTDLPSRSISIRQPAAARRVIFGSIRAGGIITMAEFSGTANKYLHLVFTLSGHELAQIGNPWADGKEIPLDPTPDGSGYLIPATGHPLRGFLWMEKKRGAAGEAAFPGLLAEVPAKWTSNHRQDGCGSVHLKFDLSSTTAYPQGVPQMTFALEGLKLLDPRLSPPADVFSDNAALAVLAYLRNEDWGLGADADEIDDALFIAAANLCDENVPLNTSPVTTEKRYTAHGSFTTDVPPADVLGQLLTAMAGRVTYVGGRWGVWPAAWRPPVVALGDADLRGGMVANRSSLRDICNGVKGTYIPAGETEPTDFPAYSRSPDRGYTQDDWLLEDLGVRVWRDVSYPYTSSVHACQRLAKIELERSRRQWGLSLAGKMSCYAARVGETVAFTHARFAWTDKSLEVGEAHWVPFEDAERAPTLGVDLVLRESDAAVYDWNAIEGLPSSVPTADLNLTP